MAVPVAESVPVAVSEAWPSEVVVFVVAVLLLLSVAVGEAESVTGFATEDELAPLALAEAVTLLP